MTATKRKALACNARRVKENPNRDPGPEVNASENSSSSSIEEQQNIIPPATVINLTISKKTNKPLMEKRRRARINESLNLLKDLVVKESDNPSKLEKADILELTVKRVREFGNDQTVAQDSFRLGFDKCLEATTDFLHFSGLGNLSHRLANHLRSRIPQMETSLLDPNPSTSIRSSSISANSPQSMDSYIDELEPINLVLSSSTQKNYSSMWRPW